MNKQGDQGGKICVVKTSSNYNGYLKISSLKQTYLAHCNSELDWHLINVQIAHKWSLCERNWLTSKPYQKSERFFGEFLLNSSINKNLDYMSPDWLSLGELVGFSR